MLVPLVDLSKGKSVVDGVYEDEALGCPCPKVSQVVHVLVSSCIPDSEIDLGLLSVLVLNHYRFVEVLNCDCVVVLTCLLSSALKERLDQHRLACTGVPHNNDFGRLRFVLFLNTLVFGQTFIFRLVLWFLNLIVSLQPGAYFLLETGFLLNRGHADIRAVSLFLGNLHVFLGLHNFLVESFDFSSFRQSLRLLSKVQDLKLLDSAEFLFLELESCLFSHFLLFSKLLFLRLPRILHFLSDFFLSPLPDI